MNGSDYANVEAKALHGRQGAAIGAVTAAPQSTLGNALATIADVVGRATDLAEYAERVAGHLAGVSAPSESLASSGRREADCLTDAINDRAESMRDPIARIHNAIARIERRIG